MSDTDEAVPNLAQIAPEDFAKLIAEASDEQIAEIVHGAQRKQVLDEIFNRMADHVEPSLELSAGAPWQQHDLIGAASSARPPRDLRELWLVARAAGAGGFRRPRWRCHARLVDRPDRERVRS